MKKRVIIIFLLLIAQTAYAASNPPVANAGEDRRVITGSSLILDASKSYDLDNNILDSDSSYIWYEDGAEIGRGINLKKNFSLGTHEITLKVTDSEGLTSNDEIKISVRSRKKCLEEDAVYFPEDTICNKKWPSQDGEELIINSRGYSCNLIEVCAKEIDPIVEEAIDCCSNNLRVDDQGRKNSCNFANKYSGKNAKKCQALYLTQSLGGNSVYMKDYLEAEMCCKGVSSLCENPSNLYLSRPLPKTGKDLSALKCFNTPDNNPPGEWVSDTKLELNNIALQDVPAHVSLNILKTGTCVDYSFSLTTLLRKLGYKQDEVYTVEAPDHAYNLVKLPLERKYTIVDTTGNNDPSIIFGTVPFGYNYCENIRKCYNDNGEAICPTLDEIYGCEDVKQNLAQKGKVLGFKTSRLINNIIQSLKTELER